MNDLTIQMIQLAKKYNKSDDYAIGPLDLKIDNSEVFGLLGPNGAGKTTLISMLSGLLHPSEGSIEIGPYNFRKNRRQIQNFIGVVPQEYALYPTLTATENLLYFGAMYGLKGKNLKSLVHKSLDDLGLYNFRKQQIRTYSGGMKRRVNLIAGILHQPKILFLDEPTVGVDVQSKNVIMEHLKRLNSLGTTIIYTSHHMVEAQYFCSRVAIVDHGIIIAKGTPNELINSTNKARNLEDVYLNLTGNELRDYV